jgi:hypothetical protein
MQFSRGRCVHNSDWPESTTANPLTRETTPIPDESDPVERILLGHRGTVKLFLLAPPRDSGPRTTSKPAAKARATGRDYTNYPLCSLLPPVEVLGLLLCSSV